LRYEIELGLRDANGNIPQYTPEELKELKEAKRQTWSRKNTTDVSTTGAAVATDKDKAK